MNEFDYVVVGAGSAGSVIAARLSENPKNQVLVIESGGRDTDPWMHIPATFFKVIEKGRDVIFYESESEASLNGRKAVVPQGHVLGGGSSVNGMIYIRGQARDYDIWAQMGNRDWSYDNVLPVFRDLESNRDFRNAYHGSEGPLSVCHRPYRHPLSQAFVAAAREAGLPGNDDFNGASQEGVGFYQSTIRNGRRWSTAMAFLRNAERRQNLRIETGRRCAKVLFDGKRAVGIALEDGAEFRCRREVILAAGALESPRLLQLSGIGNAKDLIRHGIGSIVDLPGVGENYQDHAETPVQAEVRDVPSLFKQDRGFRAVRHMLQYVVTRSGLLTSNVVESGGFANVMGGDTPDTQFHVLPLVVGFVDRAPEMVHGITINPCFLRPASRGSVKLRSANPRDKALFTSGMLSDEGDVEAQVRGVGLALRILNAPALARIVTRHILPKPGTEASRAALVEHIRDTSKTVFHPAGTCKMGLASDRMAVVGQDLRVHGIDALRVADASIMPTLVSGNTNAPAIMIGERCARFVLGSAVA